MSDIDGMLEWAKQLEKEAKEKKRVQRLSTPKERLQTVNLIEDSAKGYEESFEVTVHEIGSSEIPMGLRSNVIFKRNGLRKETNMEMHSGKMTHRNFQKEKVMYYMTKSINKALGYEEKEINGKRYIKLANGNYIEFIVRKEREKKIEVYSGFFIRLHADIEAFPYYTIEMKFTVMPKKMWGDLLTVYQREQLNIYMIFNQNNFGFLLKGDLNFYKSKSNRWSYVWNKYFQLFYHEFNQKLARQSLRKVKKFFRCIIYKIPIEQISCPCFTFECGDECKDYCPNPIVKVLMDHSERCCYCGEYIEVETTALMRNNRLYHNTKEECQQACIKDWRYDQDE